MLPADTEKTMATQAITALPIWQQMVEGRWYQTQAKPLRRWRDVVKAQCLALHSCRDPAQRQALLASLLPQCPGLDPGTGFFCDYGINIVSHAGVKIAPHVSLLDAAPIVLEAGVVLGEGVVLATVNHHPDPQRRQAGWQQARPIHIGAGAVLEPGVVVLGGSVVAAHSHIAAGQVVVPDRAAHR